MCGFLCVCVCVIFLRGGGQYCYHKLLYSTAEQQSHRSWGVQEQHLALDPLSQVMLSGVGSCLTLL